MKKLDYIGRFAFNTPFTPSGKAHGDVTDVLLMVATYLPFKIRGSNAPGFSLNFL